MYLSKLKKVGDINVLWSFVAFWLVLLRTEACGGNLWLLHSVPKLMVWLGRSFISIPGLHMEDPLLCSAF